MRKVYGPNGNVLNVPQMQKVRLSVSGEDGEVIAAEGYLHSLNGPSSTTGQRLGVTLNLTTTPTLDIPGLARIFGAER